MKSKRDLLHRSQCQYVLSCTNSKRYIGLVFKCASYIIKIIYLELRWHDKRVALSARRVIHVFQRKKHNKVGKFICTLSLQNHCKPLVRHNLLQTWRVNIQNKLSNTKLFGRMNNTSVWLRIFFKDKKTRLSICLTGHCVDGYTEALMAVYSTFLSFFVLRLPGCLKKNQTDCCMSVVSKLSLEWIESYLD